MQNATGVAYITSSIQFDPSNLSPFGSLEAVDLTPIFQGDFVYGLNTQMWNTPVTSGGATTSPTAAAMGVPEAGGRLRIISGTTSGAYAYVLSRKTVRYRAGQGNAVRLTPLFTAGQASNIQLWGIGTVYNSGGTPAFTPYDGYFFGYNGTSFGIARYRAGTPTWYARSTDWNGDKVDGSTGTSFNWNPTYGVPCMIKYPYLGYGDIEFFVQNPSNGRWVLVHTIQYANTTSTTQLANPSMYVMGYTGNSGATGGSVDMYCGSVAVFLCGSRNYVGNPKWAADVVSPSLTTEVAFLNIKNCTTYNTIANRGMIRLNSVSCSSSANNAHAIIRFKMNSSISAGAYTAVSGTIGSNGAVISAGNSIASYDTTATMVAPYNGQYVYNISIYGQNAQIVDLSAYDLFIAPGEVLTITGYGSNATTIGLSINWSEDI